MCEGLCLGYHGLENGHELVDGFAEVFGPEGGSGRSGDLRVFREALAGFVEETGTRTPCARAGRAEGDEAVKRL